MDSRIAMNFITEIRKYRYFRISGISANQPPKTPESRLDSALEIRPLNAPET